LKDANAFVVRYVPAERRAHVTAGTAEQAVDALGKFIEAGFTVFTFNNAMYRNPDQIAAVGELFRMVRPAAARGAGLGPTSGPSHPLELAAQALARPTLPTDRLDARRDLADNRRRAVVDVTRRGDRRADARFDRPDDLEDPLTFGDQRMHHVAGTDLRRRLCRVAVDTDAPAVAELGRHRPGLDQAHRAQPAINSCFVGHGSSCLLRLGSMMA
jgi:hypothetical protein